MVVLVFLQAEPWFVTFLLFSCFHGKSFILFWPGELVNAWYYNKLINTLWQLELVIFTDMGR